MHKLNAYIKGVLFCCFPFLSILYITKPRASFVHFSPLFTHTEKVPFYRKRAPHARFIFWQNFQKIGNMQGNLTSPACCARCTPCVLCTPNPTCVLCTLKSACVLCTQNPLTCCARKTRSRAVHAGTAYAMSNPTCVLYVFTNYLYILTY